MPSAITCPDAIRVVSFDLDDTLWDCSPALAHAERTLFRWLRVHTPRIVAAHDAASLVDYRVQMRQQHPELQGCVTASRLQGLRALLAQFDYPETLAEEAFEVFYQARSQVIIYPGVLELLQLLSGRMTIVAITNGNADMERIGLAEYFDTIFAADLELLAKPNVDMFERCLKKFDITKDQMLHIGDNPYTDIGGAHAAGVQSLWFNQYDLDWPHDTVAPHFEVRSIAELSRFFE